MLIERWLKPGSDRKQHKKHKGRSVRGIVRGQRSANCRAGLTGWTQGIGIRGEQKRNAPVSGRRPTARSSTTNHAITNNNTSPLHPSCESFCSVPTRYKLATMFASANLVYIRRSNFKCNRPVCPCSHRHSIVGILLPIRPHIIFMITAAILFMANINYTPLPPFRF